MTKHSTLYSTLYRLLIIGLVFISGTASAQKYGHANFANIVTSMPEAVQAEQALAAFQEKLIAEGEALLNKFQDDLGKFQQRVRAGKLTISQQKEGEGALQTLQNEIRALEADAPIKLERERNKLLEPIVKKVEKAVALVASENGYQVIFDTSLFNALLYAAESQNVESLINQKLGLSN